MLSAMIARRRRSSGRMPRTTAPRATLLAVAMTWPSTIGATRITPGTSATRAAAAS